MYSEPALCDHWAALVLAIGPRQFAIAKGMQRQILESLP
jgi:hypothetical protein